MPVTSNNNLTKKENMLLQDQKSHEQICVQKYTNYANQTQDKQLKQLFKNYAQQEQQHLDTVSQILNGNVPQVNQNQNQQQMFQTNQTQNQNQSEQAGMVNQNDAALCNDVLMTEKYVSGAYDNAIFEFTNPNIRQVLNHIQKEEQQHGEGVFNYMQNHGMYNS